VPVIFNTNQGSQYTCEAYISVFKDHRIQISIGDNGHALDKMYVERLWRSL